MRSSEYQYRRSDDGNKYNKKKHHLKNENSITVGGKMAPITIVLVMINLAGNTKPRRITMSAKK